MTLSKKCSCCKNQLTTKNTYSIGRNIMGLWLNCKICKSTVLFLDKSKKEF